MLVTILLVYLCILACRLHDGFIFTDAYWTKAYLTKNYFIITCLCIIAISKKYHCLGVGNTTRLTAVCDIWYGSIPRLIYCNLPITTCLASWLRQTSAACWPTGWVGLGQKMLDAHGPTAIYESGLGLFTTPSILCNTVGCCILCTSFYT